MNLRALLIDDSEDDTELLLRYLKRHGCDVTWQRVDTAEALREALAVQEWDIALCDYVMPYLSGPEALRILRTRAPNLPAIAVSGQVGEEYAVEVTRAGAKDYVRKDSLSRLMPIIERELAETRQRQHLTQVETALEISEDRFRAMFEQAPLGIALFDLRSGRIYEANPAYARIVGRSREELLGLEWAALTHPEDVAMERERFTRQLAGDSTAGSLRKRYLRPDGTLVWAQLTIAAVAGADPQHPIHLCMVEDITERRTADDSVPAANNHTNAALERRGQDRKEQPTRSETQYRTVVEQTGLVVYDYMFPSSTAARPAGPGGEAIQAATDSISGRFSVRDWMTRLGGPELATALPADLDGIDIAAPRAATHVGDVERLTGFTPAEAAAMSMLDWVDRIHPDDLSAALPTFANAVIEGRNYALEYRFRRKDGREAHLLDRAVIIHDPSDGSWRLLGTLVDVTGMKAAEAAVRRSEEKYRSLFNASRDAIMLLDETDFVDANPATLALFRCASKDEFVGRSPADFSPPEQPDGTVSSAAALARISEAFDTGRATFEWQHKRADGTLFLAEVQLTRSRVEAQPLLQAAVRDITEQRQAELELRSAKETAEIANASLESFNYSVSHDLRAPLRQIEGFVNILDEDFGPQLPAEARGHLARVRQGSQRMNSMIEALLRLSRVGRSVLEPRRIDLAEIARAAFRDLHTAAPDQPVEFVVDDLPKVVGDPVLLRQLFDNLIGNAIKFTRPVPAPRIEVGVDRHHKNAVFFVRDNGVGFAEEQAERLFEVFERLHKPSEFEGTGIGLSIVKRIVQKHNGWVWAESLPGAGATFYFTLELG